MRVLIVDDELAFAGPLAQRLGLRGMETRTAHDANEALNILHAWPAELVFLDVGLPGMDGVALLKIIREKHPQTDVVMLSGAADMGKAVQAMRRGAFNWLSKPVDIEQVLEECRKARERAAVRQEAARLAEAARWRSLGRVAEGVAHEVNNPLNIVVQVLFAIAWKSLKLKLCRILMNCAGPLIPSARKVCACARLPANCSWLGMGWTRVLVRWT